MRKSRKNILADNGLNHKIYKTHNKEFLLAPPVEKNHFLNSMAKTYKKEIKDKVKWIGFCIMSNHCHEIIHVLPDENKNLKESISLFGNWMRNGHSIFGAGYNKRHGRLGKVAYDRAKTIPVKESEDDNLHKNDEVHNEDVLTLMHYIDANPVKPGMVSHPSKFKHSSYHYYALGKKNEITKHLTPPQEYLNLGKTPKMRQKRYRQLTDAYLRTRGLIPDPRVLPQGEKDTGKDCLEDDLSKNNNTRGSPET